MGEVKVVDGRSKWRKEKKIIKEREIKALYFCFGGEVFENKQAIEKER